MEWHFSIKFIFNEYTALNEREYEEEDDDDLIIIIQFSN